VSLEKSLVEWANGRPDWQRQVLSDLCAGKSVDPEALATTLLEGKAVHGPPILSEADIPGGSSGGHSVALASISETEDLNALLTGQELTLAPAGLTVIYGDNASGKSGYARVIKVSSGARHQLVVLSNVFVKSATQPKAKISIVSGGATTAIEWPTDAHPDLRRIHFYDEACGDAYLDSETKLTYRPSALTLLNRLIEVLDSTRAELDMRLQQNAASRGSLPTVEAPSSAAAFLEGLSAQTTPAEIEAASAHPVDAADQIARHSRELVRLEESNPTKERARLQTNSRGLSQLANHLERTERALGPAQVKIVSEAATRAKERRAAAEIASKTSFDNEPVQGVGTERWRALWKAARDFSVETAYHEHEFPFLGEGARCVLCQQEFDADAVDRMTRFDAFMRDQTEKEARKAEADVTELVAGIRSFETQPAGINTLFSDLRDEAPNLIERSQAWLDDIRQARSELLGKFDTGEQFAEHRVAPPPVSDLRSASVAASEAAAKIDDVEFKKTVDTSVSARRDLIGRVRLADGNANLETEVARLKNRAALEKAKLAVDTGAITRKSSDLTKAHVTELIRDRFTRETEKLGLDKITLKDVGGQKGQLQQRPALLGAQAPAKVGEVFSEGEQTALGLAGYFTEAYFDEGKSALVLDDPVTSLDHIRRSRVAERLAAFATERQVVVFTHDVRFVAELRASALSENASFEERSVQRSGSKDPGVVTNQLPWKAKDISGRFDWLRVRLEKIEKNRAAWTPDEYEEQVQLWAGKLSEVWERIVNLEIVNQVVDRGSSEVRPKMFKLLARITQQDDDELQQSYDRISGWAPRHDKDPDVNFVAPEPDILQKELALVRTWYDRVRKYRN